MESLSHDLGQGLLGAAFFVTRCQSLCKTIPIYDYFLLWSTKTGSFYARDHETSLGTIFFVIRQPRLQTFRFEDGTDVTFFVSTSAIVVGYALHVGEGMQMLIARSHVRFRNVNRTACHLPHIVRSE